MIDGDLTCNGKTATARRAVSAAEPFALGHYPHRALFPGVLVLELFTVVAEGLVRAATGNADCRVTTVIRIQFLGEIRPGDVIVVETRISRETAESFEIRCTAKVDATKKASGTLVVQLGLQENRP